MTSIMSAPVGRVMGNGFTSVRIALATGNFGKYRQVAVNLSRLQSKAGAKDSNRPMGASFTTQKVSVSRAFGKYPLRAARRPKWWLNHIRDSGRCWIREDRKS